MEHIEKTEQARERLVKTTETLTRKEESLDARARDVLSEDSLMEEMRRAKTDTEKRLIRDGYCQKDEEWRKRDRECREARIEHSIAKIEFDSLTHMFASGVYS